MAHQQGVFFCRIREVLFPKYSASSVFTGGFAGRGCLEGRGCVRLRQRYGDALFQFCHDPVKLTALFLKARDLTPLFLQFVLSVRKGPAEFPAALLKARKAVLLFL